MQKTTETHTQGTNPKLSRWTEGHAPEDVIAQLQAEVEDIQDLMIVLRYIRSSREDDTYNVLSSTMSMHELLGLLDLGKFMSVTAHRVDVDDLDDAS